MSLEAFFKKLGAPLANVRWSWGGVRENGDVVLRVWTDRKIIIDGKVYRQLLDAHRGDKTVSGYLERHRHVDMINQGAKCYMVMLRAEDKNASPRTIESFIKDRVWVGGKLIENEEGYFIECLGPIKIDGLKKAA